ESVAGLAIRAGQAVGAGGVTESAGVPKTFLPAVAADVVAVCHRGNGVGEITVVNGAVLLEGIGGTLVDLQGHLRDRRVASDSDSPAEIDLVVDIALFDIR